VSAPLTGGGALAAALGIGVAFGWCLERAGLGSARKLVAQFHHTDLAVFKMLFSAVVTAMLGAFWLARLGVLDLGAVYVPETWLVPQLVGGLLFGAGMAIAGLCPGTACVSAATGRGDGVAVVGGFLLGVLAAGLALPSIEGFYRATPRGALTLPRALSLPHGTVVLLVVALALAGFALAGRVERAHRAEPRS
jgi:uncharacterized membrane protein YedE/YeeE